MLVFNHLCLEIYTASRNTCPFGGFWGDPVFVCFECFGCLFGGSEPLQTLKSLRTLRLHPNSQYLSGIVLSVLTVLSVLSVWTALWSAANKHPKRSERSNHSKQLRTSITESGIMNGYSWPHRATWATDIGRDWSFGPTRPISVPRRSSGKNIHS